MKNRIEFIGSSYVGKSYLYEKLNKSNKLNSKFITHYQLRKRNLSFLFKYLVKRKGIEKNSIIEKEDLFNYYDTLHFYFNEKFNNEIDKKFYINNCTNIMNKILFFKKTKFYFPDSWLICEESVLHWHFLLKKAILSKKKFNFSNKDYGLFPKGVVFCYNNNKETILNRIMERYQHNAINKNHSNMEIQDILNKVLNNQAYFFDLCDFLTYNNVNVLTIDTDNPCTDNLNRILDFSNKLLMEKPVVHLENK